MSPRDRRVYNWLRPPFRLTYIAYMDLRDLIRMCFGGIV